MKFIETYTEFDGSDVRIYKRDGKTYLPFWKRIFYRYYWETREFAGDAFTLRQAKNDARSKLLDKEWENLPRNARERNVRRSNYS